MDYNEQIAAGIVGTTVSATGAALSLSDVQLWVSIIVTALGFIIGVLVPAICKLVKYIKEAKSDGKIDADEAKEIINQTKEIIDKTVDKTEEIVDKINNKEAK